MSRCDHCGNDYEPSLHITWGGESYTFDCFECAIHALAPECFHCGCKIIGHGMQSGENYYCCAHCARQEGIHDVKDNADK